jgi:hypothetical protein
MSTIEDKIIKDLSDEISAQIDWEILEGVFKECGWVTITFNPIQSDYKTFLIREWLEENCKGHRRSRGNKFMFELESDAINFSLRWS